MTDLQKRTALQEAASYTDIDAFVSDLLLSSAFIDPDDETAEPDVSLIPELKALWHVANDSFKDLLKAMGLTQTECSRRFCVPLRTVQHWALEERSCAIYVRLMMAELTGYVK